MKLLTDAEVFGGGGLSDDAVFGTDKTATPDTWKTKAKLVGQDLRTRAGDVAQLPAAVGDMIYGAIPATISQVKGMGAYVNERLQGGSRAEAEAAGTKGKDLGWFESFKTPFQSAVKALTGAEHYDQAIVEKAFEAASERGSALTNGRLTPYDINEMLSVVMNTLGVKGVKPASQAIASRVVARETAKRQAKMKPPEGQLSDAEVFGDAKPDLSSIPEPVEVTPKILKEIFEKAKSPEAQVDALFERAKRNRVPQAMQDFVGREGDRLIGERVSPTEKTRLPNEGSVIGEYPAPEIDPVLDSAMRKVSADQRWDLTAEERIALQRVAQESKLVGEDGKPLRSKQGGYSDLQLALWMAGAAGVGVAGADYISKNHPDLARTIRKRVRTFLGLEKSDQEKRNDDAERQRRINDEQQKYEDRLNNGWEPPIEYSVDGNPLAMNDPKDWLVPTAIGMAVKGKGGMWHPEAVSRLSNPLFLKLAPESRADLGADYLRKTLEAGVKYIEGSPADLASKAAKWSDNAVARYLNKYAGTEGDPLKDVEVPFGEGVRRWETLMDQAVGKRAAGDYASRKALKASGMTREQRQEGYMTQGAIEGLNKLIAEGKVKPEEPIYQFADGSFERVFGHEGNEVGSSGKAIASYLSHVGDYLRQNVSPEKLPQYDLVRAVKETAKNDERVAKEMEKASAASTAQLPVYREYPDGMKWVELKLPEKLTEEQARGVRKLEQADADGMYYEAIDAQGKSIRNSYTEERARGRTAPEAFLAGRLAEEGNALGHCVGGYCDAVAGGESRIFSLRDAKGKSHVTVETGAEKTIDQIHVSEIPQKLFQDFEDWAMKQPDKVSMDNLKDFLQTQKPKELFNLTRPDIVQIKGAQNRAPAAKYLPYVQDFVRGEKWGEVGDLENTGLIELEAIRRKTYEGYGLPEDRFISRDEFEAVQQRFRNDPNRPSTQQGAADPKLLAGIAAAGSIAAYLNENPQDTEALAAAGLLASTKKGLGQVGRGLDYTLGLISTRIGSIDPALKRRARDYERVVMERTDKALDRAAPFLAAVKETKGAAADELKLALLDGSSERIAEAIKGKPKLVAGWRQVQNLLREFESEHKALGRFKEGITNYFPRVVEDLEGLKSKLDGEVRTALEENLMKAEAKMMKEQDRGLTDIERSIIVNRSLAVDPGLGRLPDYARARRVREMTEELAPYYASPIDSLLRYISASVQDSEMAKFFGRNLKTKKDGKQVFTDVDASIGSVVEEQLKSGNVTPEEANTLRALLKSRFEGGEQAMSGPLQDIRNATNAGLLGNVVAAATQIGDSIITVYHHGLMPTLRALKDKLTGDSEVTTKQFGLVNHVAEELGSARASGKALNFLFKYTGFQGIDQFAKNLNLNAGLNKWSAAAKTVAGAEKLEAKYAKAFGDEFPQLLDDLRNGRMSEPVKSLLFSELSDAQPISKMEMPQAYLDHPNGRILYQLKTYMLKQMDIIRRDAYEQIADGHYVEGAKNLLAVAAALSLSNIPGDVVKDWLKGRPIDLAKIDYVDNLLRTFGLSRYTTDKATSGKPGQAVEEFAVGMVKPPALSMAKEALDDPTKLAKYVPFIGRTVYDRELGGNEAYYRAEAKRERLKQRALRESENPYLRDVRLERERRRRERAAERARKELAQ